MWDTLNNTPQLSIQLSMCMVSAINSETGNHYPLPPDTAKKRDMWNFVHISFPPYEPFNFAKQTKQLKYHSLVSALDEIPPFRVAFHVAVAETSQPSKQIWLSNAKKINDLSHLFRCDTCCTVSLTMVWQVSIWTLFSCLDDVIMKRTRTKQELHTWKL